MNARSWKVAIVVGGLLLGSRAFAWEEGVIVDFGGQSYEGWSGISQPATPGPRASVSGNDALPVQGHVPAAPETKCRATGDGSNCAPARDRDDSPGALSSSAR